MNNKIEKIYREKNIKYAVILIVIYVLLTILLVMRLSLQSVPIPIFMITIIGIGYTFIGLCVTPFIEIGKKSKWQILIRLSACYMILCGIILCSLQNIIDAELIYEKEIQIGTITKITKSEIEWEEGNWTYTTCINHDEQKDISINNKSFQNAVTRMHCCADTHVHDFGIIKISCSSYQEAVLFSSYRYYIEPDAYEKLFFYERRSVQ